MSRINSYSISYSKGQKKSESNNKFSKLLTFLAAVLILSLLITVFYSLISFSENTDNFRKHEIKKGESLWSIAAKYHNPNSVDLRKIIYEIKNLNNIDSAVITPGEKIIIPLD